MPVKNICLLVLLSISLAAQAQSSMDSGIYSLSQASVGNTVYGRECSLCHGPELEGAEGGPALTGKAFRDKWREHSLAEFYEMTRQTMPVTKPAGLPENEYASVIAFILNRNAYVAGASDLVYDADALDTVVFVEPRASKPMALHTSTAAEGLTVEWLHHRGDAGSTNYSPLDIINRDNVTDLKVAWRWRSDNFGPASWPNLETTPLMANGVLYATAGIRRAVVAIDAETGETLWMYRLDEGERGENAPRKGPGRGVAYRRDGSQETIFVISPGYRLIALNAKNGLPIDAFGDGGIVDLKESLDQDMNLEAARIGSSSPPMVVGDVVVVGSAFPAGGAPPTKEMPAGSVTGYDAITGERLWIFHTIPQPGEPGHETWMDDSWKYTGNVGVWAPMSADPELGYVYLPTEAPTGDYYGGHRPGDNLYSQSLVCLDAKTGERVWHFQTVHHPIWDYDLPAPPVLIDINVAGKKIPAVAQITKHGLTFVFDRRTGEPVWPIIETPVAASNVPGETTSPTQPIPSLPEPFMPNGVTDDSLNNLTPEILAEARKIASEYTLGPVYTPATLYTETNKGTLMSPSGGGGANWQGAVADPVSGIMYVSSAATLGVLGMISDPDRSNMKYVQRSESIDGPFGLPLLRPPWGRITAIDLNTGKILWTIANGDTPDSIRKHEKLVDVDLPRTGHLERAGLLVTRSLLFAGEGAGLYGMWGGGTMFRAHDKRTGEILAEVDLGGVRQSGIPMTYAIDGKQYIVVAAGAPNHAGELVALTIAGE
jgi:quinoprotein glucose dehydrogenase